MLAELITPQVWEMLKEAVPVIISLIIIEGLLSVDNALAIAAMASHLPEKQRFWALRVGILGAYFFRGLALLFATFIIEHPWLKLVGAAYLIHLMAHHFARTHAASEENSMGKVVHRGFWATVASIELMDLSLGVDNVVAAVALSDKFWVVCTGVFIGILALRLVAGHCIGLIEKFPVLQHTAFILIGYVGAILVAELTLHIDITTMMKFAGIVAIIALSIAYSRVPAVKAILQPLLKVFYYPIRLYELVVGSIFHVLFIPFHYLFSKIRLPEPAEEVEHAEEILREADHRKS